MQRIAPVCCAAALAAATWGQDYLPSAELYAAGLVKFWQVRLPLEPGQQLVDLYLVDDQLFATTGDGFAYALDAVTGAPRWVKQVTRGGYRLWRPTRAQDRAVFVTPAMVTEFDWYLGTPIRAFPLRYPASSPAASDGSLLFIGGVNQRLYAFAIGTDYERWKVVTSGQVISRPLLHGGILYFASDSGHVFACKPASKRKVWVRRPGGAVTADLAADENGVYVASRDNSLYLLEAGAGGTRWRARLSGPLLEPPALTPSVVYQYCADDGLVAINTAGLGEVDRIRWKLPEGRRLLTVNDTLAYVLTRDEQIAAVRILDGAVVHRIAATGFGLSVSVPGEKVLFLAAPDGRLFCARDAKAPLVTREQVLAALRAGTGPRQPAGAQAASAPAAEETPPQPPAAQDALSSSDTGPPLGGKSKVSRSYSGG